MQVHFAGHSTSLVELDGVRVLMDPLFRGHLLHLQRHAPAIDEGIYGRPDVLLISHSHLDHLDRRSVKTLPRDIVVVVPNDCVELMRGFGFKNVLGASEDETVEAAGLSFRAVKAIHGGKRWPWNDWTEALGWVVSGSQSFYFAGDTDLYQAMRELAPVDLALLPVWGWGPKLGVGHLDPRRAAQAVELIRPRVAVPIHWGGFLLAGMHRKQPHLLTEPPLKFCSMVEQLGVPTRVEIIQPGASATVDPA